MRLKAILIGATILVLLGGCRRHESVDGSYGNGVVSGQVVMASSMVNSSPAGVQVTLQGTGMTTILGPDGHFLFSGVPDNATLHFNRAADVADVKMNISGTSTGPLVIELSSSSAHTGGHHRAAPSEPESQYEGKIVTVSATSITIADSHGTNVTLAITDKTGIRQGHKTLTPADLTAGTQVHVKAISVSGTLTATEIVVQDDSTDDNGGTTMTANGTVKAVGASSLTVTTPDKGDVTVNVDKNTIIRKQGTTIQLSDIKVGDQVNTLGTKVDDHTLLARQIEVRGVGQGDVMTAEGTVKSVGASSLVVTTEDHGDVTVNVDKNTIIRKQGTTIQLTDIKVGDQVNTLGTKVDDHTLLARQIEVRGVGQGDVMTAEGTVKSVGASSLVVTSEDNGDITVNVDANTTIRKQGSTIQLSDIKAGDQVEAVGTRVDDHTLLARQIEVSDSGSGHHH